MNTAPTTPPTSTRPAPKSPSLMAYTAAYCIAFIALGMTVATLGPTLPELARHTGVSIGQISILFSARSLGFLITVLSAARLYDRVAGHWVLITALLLLAVATFLAPLVPWLVLLALIWAIIGAGQGLLNVGANTLMTWVHGRNVSPYLNALHFFAGIGAVIAPIIIAQLVQVSGDIKWAYWVMALLILPLAPALLRLPSPPIERADADVDAPGNKTRWLVPLFTLLLLLYCGAEISFSGWIFSYAVTLGLGDPTTAAYLTSAFWAAYTLSRLMWIFLSKKVRTRDILVYNLIGGGLSLALIMVWPGSPVVLWIGTIGAGWTLGPIFANVLVLARKRMTISGRVMGLFFGGVAFGSMTVPLVIGQLFEVVGPQAVMLTILVDLCLALVVAGVLIVNPWATSSEEE